jgi:hypothetical protein
MHGVRDAPVVLGHILRKFNLAPFFFSAS